MLRYFSVAFICLVCASLARGYLDDTLLNDDLRELIASLHKTCMSQTGVDNDMIMKTNEGVFPNDKNLKCYMKCILLEGAAMEENGDLDFSAVEEIIPDALKEPIKNMFDTCTPAAKNADLCEKSFEFYTCCYKTDPKNYFLI